MDDLTPAQKALLERVRTAGVLYFNGRAAHVIRALRDKGFVVASVEPVARADGRHTTRWTVRPK